MGSAIVITTVLSIFTTTNDLDIIIIVIIIIFHMNSNSPFVIKYYKYYDRADGLINTIINFRA